MIGATAGVATPAHGSPAGSAEPEPDGVEATARPTEVGASSQAVRRRYRLPMLGVLVLLVAVAGMAVVERHGVHGRLDPRAVDRTGSAALAALLRGRGVDVQRVTSVAEAAGSATDRDVVLVAFPDLLPAADLHALADSTVGRLVLVAPDAQALRNVTDQVSFSGTAPAAARDPGCGAPAAIAAGVVDIGGQVYRPSGGGTGCYGTRDGSGLVLAQTGSGSDLAVLGSGDLLTNERLGEQGNAALALNLLGADGSADRVRWLVPTPGSAATGNDRLSVSDILPSWGPPAALQLLVAALLAALWRARRLGPPVTEPLPVVVRAAETVEGRARLYRRAQARDRAADALRAGARAKLVPRLGLDPTSGGEPSPVAVADAVADRAGMPSLEVHEALYGEVPADDPALVRLADALDTIVRSTLASEVRRP